MTSKEFLSQYSIVNDRIKANKEKMLRAERQNSFSRKTQQWISSYLDRLYDETEELYKLKHLIENVIDRCPCSEKERRVLYERYILMKLWREIADDMNFSSQHINRIHNAALKKVVVPIQYR